MTTSEIQATIAILSRCPMTPGEQIFIQNLFGRLAQEAAEAEKGDQAQAPTQLKPV